MATTTSVKEEEVAAVVHHQPQFASNQLDSIGIGENKSANKFGSDTIAAQLNSLQLSEGAADAKETNCVVVPQPVIVTTATDGRLGGDGVGDQQQQQPLRQNPSRLKIGRSALDDLLQHNNSVCVDFDSSANSDLMNIVSEAAAGDTEEEEEEEEGDIDKVQSYQQQHPREARKSEGDGGTLAGGGGGQMPAQIGKRVHNSKSMCDNDLRVDHLINKKDSMRIRFDDNGEAQIQKRDILHRKFYKSVDDELHKKTVASMSGGKSQCMTLDRVFKKLRGQIRKLWMEVRGCRRGKDCGVIRD